MVFTYYARCNIPGKGIPFAMLPASKGQKYLILWINTVILTPLISMAASLLVDTLLSLIPTGPFHQQFCWQQSFLATHPNVILPVVLAVMAASTTFVMLGCLLRRNKRAVSFAIIIPCCILGIVLIGRFFNFYYNTLPGTLWANPNTYTLGGSLLLILYILAVSLVGYRSLRRATY